MRTPEFAGRAAARISQDEVAVDAIVFQQCSRQNWVSFYPLLTVLLFANSLALLWLCVSDGMGLLGPGCVSGKAAQECQAGAVGIS